MAFGLLGGLIGLLLIFFGGFLVFFLPAAVHHQPKDFAIGGIIIGLFCAIIGFFLLLF